VIHRALTPWHIEPSLLTSAVGPDRRLSMLNAHRTPEIEGRTDRGEPSDLRGSPGIRDC